MDKISEFIWWVEDKYGFLIGFLAFITILAPLISILCVLIAIFCYSVVATNGLTLVFLLAFPAWLALMVYNYVNCYK